MFRPTKQLTISELSELQEKKKEESISRAARKLMAGDEDWAMWTSENDQQAAIARVVATLRDMALRAVK